MRKSVFALFAAGLFCTSIAFAQDAVQVAPKNFKVLAENDKVRVLEYTAKKGEKVAMHSHPALVVYVLKGGKTKFIMPDGKAQESAVKMGDVVLRDPVTHSHESIDDAHAIVVELKK